MFGFGGLLFVWDTAVVLVLGVFLVGVLCLAAVVLVDGGCWSFCLGVLY